MQKRYRAYNHCMCIYIYHDTDATICITIWDCTEFHLRILLKQLFIKGGHHDVCQPSAINSYEVSKYSLSDLYLHYLEKLPAIRGFSIGSDVAS